MISTNLVELKNENSYHNYFCAVCVAAKFATNRVTLFHQLVDDAKNCDMRNIIK